VPLLHFLHQAEPSSHLLICPLRATTIVDRLLLTIHPNSSKEHLWFIPTTAPYLLYHTSWTSLSLTIDSTSQDILLSLVWRSVCIYATLSSPQLYFAYFRTNRPYMQLCVWDWLLAISDEFEILRHRQRRCVGYFYNAVYLITRWVTLNIDGITCVAAEIISSASVRLFISPSPYRWMVCLFQSFSHL
jgi:hypothetical protein